MNEVLHSRYLIAALLLLLALASPACGYGKSVEDLVGSFSIEKTVKIGSSSECFSSPDAPTDPLAPPQSGAVGPLADDQPPGLAGLTLEPQEISAALPQTVNLTAHLIDDQGIWAARAEFSGPAGEQATALFSTQNLTSGDGKDGIYTAQILLPPGNETEEWHLQNMIIVDREGNRRSLALKDLLGQGLTAVIRIV
ncbi:MAG: hypothetical protein PHQ34_14460 [Methanothrix sp.]|nr:hypothetical protein [Methanothrix sp.]